MLTAKPLHLHNKRKNNTPQIGTTTWFLVNPIAKEINHGASAFWKLMPLRSPNPRYWPWHMEHIGNSCPYRYLLNEIHAIAQYKLTNRFDIAIQIVNVLRHRFKKSAVHCLIPTLRWFGYQAIPCGRITKIGESNIWMLSWLRTVGASVVGHQDRGSYAELTDLGWWWDIVSNAKLRRLLPNCAKHPADVSTSSKSCEQTVGPPKTSRDPNGVENANQTLCATQASTRCVSIANS